MNTCTSRGKWFHLNVLTTFSALTLLIFTDRTAEGYSKKAAKRKAATMMYHALENVVASGEIALDRGREDAAYESLTGYKPMPKE